MSYKNAFSIIFLAILTTVSSHGQTKFTLENTVGGSSEYAAIAPRPAYGQFCLEDEKFVQTTPNRAYVCDGDTIINAQNLTSILSANGKNGQFARLHWLTTADLWAFVPSDSAIYRIDLTAKNITDSIVGVGGYYDMAAGAGNVAFGDGSQLFVAGKQGVTIVSDTVADGIVWGQSVHRNEFGIMKGTFWSPDGTKLAFYKMDETMVAKYPIVDIGARSAAYAPIRYPMAGETSHEVAVGIYNTDTKTTVYLQTASPKDRYFTNIAWSPDGSKIVVAEVNRDQNHLWFNIYNPTTGAFIKTLFEETNDEWVEPCFAPLFIDNNRFAWLSERDGFRHIYLYDTSNGQCQQLTKGSWCVTDLYAYSPKLKTIFFQANERGYLYKDVYSVTLGGKMKRLTADAGVHTATFSASAGLFLDNLSSPEMAASSTLRKADGKAVELLKAVADPYEGFDKPEIRLVDLTSADGQFPLTGRMILPTDFDSTRVYPAIVYVYGGPHAQLVDGSWLNGASPWMLYFAQQGYIVFSMDNRGSENRGVAFEHVIHRQLGKCEMEDQMMGVKYLKSLPYIDNERIGVHGWSFGGFMTISLMLDYNDVFKMGVAGGPVTDWSLYEVMYGERYMDTPQQNPDGYAATNVCDKIGKLRGRLLVIHGDIDPVVVLQHSLRLLQKSVDEDVMVDYAIYPGHEHNVLGPDRVHLIKRIFRAFEEGL